MTETNFHDDFQFPYHAEPRTWLIISGVCITGLRLARALLDHGDNVVIGTPPSVYEEVMTSLETPFSRYDSEQLRVFLTEELYDHDDWRPRCKLVRLAARVNSQCQAAVAQAVDWFGGLDIMVCNSSEVVIGTVEELGQSPETLALMREQFETSFFGSVNAIKAALPVMRKKHNGHIVVITGITSHLGTPGLGAFCAAGWAIEGYCDSLAYEIAPFNVKMSIVQPHLESAVLPSRIRAAPLMPEYASWTHPAPLARNVIGGLLDRIYGIEPTTQRHNSAATQSTNSSEETRPMATKLGPSPNIHVEEPRLPLSMQDKLIAETLFSVCAIGGHPNPPQRHIVGTEAVVSVKEKLKAVNMELEDLVQASTAVDLEWGS